MQVKIKKLCDHAVIPTYAKPGDGGMDMTCTTVNVTDAYYEYETGLSMEIPEGFVGLLFPRSSNSKYALLLCNSVGVIDAGYRGPINFRYKHVGSGARYNVGDRVGQIMIVPRPEVTFVEAEELSDTVRGSDGFGSTGK